MVIKLTHDQFKYFNQKLKIERPDLFKFVIPGASRPIVIESNVVCEIRDWLGEKLQVEGFDNSYELNQEGKIIEELIDLFYE